MYYNGKNILGVFKKANDNLKFGCFADAKLSSNIPYLTHHSLPSGPIGGGKLSLIRSADSAKITTMKINATAFGSSFVSNEITLYTFMNSYITPMPDFNVTNQVGTETTPQHVSINVSKISGSSNNTIAFSIILRFNPNELLDSKYFIALCNPTKPSDYMFIDKTSFTSRFVGLGDNIYVLRDFGQIKLTDISTLYMPALAFVKITQISNATTLTDVSSSTLKYMDAAYLTYAK